MDTSTGMIAVIFDDGRAHPDALAASVAYARSASEIVRAIVASPRPEEIQEAVTPAAAFPADAAEVASGPTMPLLERISRWAEHLDGEKVRLVACLHPDHPVSDPWVVYECLQRMMTNGFADGIVGVNPKGRGVRGWKHDGEWTRPVEGAAPLTEDQSIYVFRRAIVEDQPDDWRSSGHFLPYEIKPITK